MRIALLLFLASVFSCFASIIPADRQCIWWSRPNIGVEGGIPNSSNMTVFATVAAGASLTTVNNTLASCPSNQVVQLSSGTYTFGNNVFIPSGVVLRGTGMSNTVIAFTSGGITVGGSAWDLALRFNSYSGGGPATWTATNYAAGSSNLIFSTVSPGLAAGNYVFLDQSNDSFYVNPVGYADASGQEPPYVGPRDATHDMCQWSKVTAVNGTTVTIWPPLAATWWSASLGPAAIWIGQSAWTARVGVENLLVDGTLSSGSGAAANIDFESARDCWVKGVASLNGNNSHVFFGYGFFRCEVRDSYFWGTKNALSSSYGVMAQWGSGLLCENNVFEKVSIGMLSAGSTGPNVFAYNYCTNDWYVGSPNFLFAGIAAHSAHDYMELYEGNHFPKYVADFQHGSHSHEVLFRNRISGWEAFSFPSGPTANGIFCELFDITNRYCSVIGNILGTVGQYTQYQSIPTAPLNYDFNGVEYMIGMENKHFVTLPWPDDTNTWATFYRHMDYDVVTGGITYNSTNADVTLPPSLVYSSKPAWWGCAPWPPFNPTNGVAAASIDPTNIPAGYWKVYGRYPTCFLPQPTNATLLSIGKSVSKGKLIMR